MEQLILRLGVTEDDPILWGVWDERAATILASGTLANAADLVTLQERAANRPVYALVPNSAVNLTTVSLPPGAGKKVLNAIGFMLEDDIAGDITSQHIAFGPQKKQEQKLAIVDKQQMQIWLDWLATAELHTSMLVPEALALVHSTQITNAEIAEPATADSSESSDHSDSTPVALMTIGDEIIGRIGDWGGVSGHKDWVGPWLYTWSQQHAPVSMTQYSADVANLCHKPVHSQQPPLELPMHVFAKGLNQLQKSAPFTLRQGEFKAPQRTNKNWVYWRTAAAVVGIAFIFGVIDKSLELSALKAQNTALKAQIQQNIQRNFPGIGPYRDARRSIAQYIKARENAGSGASGIAMLANLSTAFATSQLQAQTLRFDQKRSEIRIQAVANKFADLEAFSKAARDAGLTVEQGAINNKGGQLVGTLIIKG